MTLKGGLRMVFITILIPVLLTGCKSTVDKYTLSSCKVVETNITKCSQLIADDMSNKNANIVSSVDEGDL